MKIDRYQCNVCRCLLSTDSVDELMWGAMAFRPVGRVGCAYEKMERCDDTRDGDVHICGTCLQGIGHIAHNWLPTPAPLPKENE